MSFWKFSFTVCFYGEKKAERKTDHELLCDYSLFLLFNFHFEFDCLSIVVKSTHRTVKKIGSKNGYFKQFSCNCMFCKPSANHLQTICKPQCKIGIWQKICRNNYQILLLKMKNTKNLKQKIWVRILPL